MTGRLVLVVVCCAALLTGCGSGRRPPDAHGFATHAERMWLRSVGRWRVETVGPFTIALSAYVRSYGQTSQAHLRAAAATVAGCQRALDALGPPPTRRLEPVARLLSRACVKFEALGRLIHDHLRSSVAFGTLTNTPAHELEHGGALTTRAFRLAIVGWRRHLPTRRNESHTDASLNRAASIIAGKHVEVHCWAPRAWSALGREFALINPRTRDVALAGWAFLGGDTIELQPDVCRRLEDNTGPVGLPSAVRVLAHESVHAAGTGDEAVTECDALQLVPQAARSLGYEAANAHALGALAWLDYPREPARYRTSLCVRGGALDLHRHDTVWR
jgi:hypothetical protein